MYKLNEQDIVRLLFYHQNSYVYFMDDMQSYTVLSLISSLQYASVAMHVHILF